MSKSVSIDWCAGFFEGEGNAYVRVHKNKKTPHCKCLTLQITQVHREPLDAFAETMGVGTVRGPYGPYSTTKQAYYQYAVNGVACIEVSEKLIPLMFRKGEQVQEALNEYKEYLNG